MKLYFNHAVMGAGKSAMLCMSVYEYRKSGANVLVIKPEIDTRNKIIKSRIGLWVDDCLSFNDKTDVLSLVKNSEKKIDIIFVDEIHFFSPKAIYNFAYIANVLETPVMCYGLMLDSNGNLFDGSKAMIENGAKLQEIKSATVQGRLTHHLRYVNGTPVFNVSADEIIAPGDEEYKSVTWKVFNGFN